jgi:hypothetical protein
MYTVLIAVFEPPRHYILLISKIYANRMLSYNVQRLITHCDDIHPLDWISFTVVDCIRIYMHDASADRRRIDFAVG